MKHALALSDLRSMRDQLVARVRTINPEFLHLVCTMDALSLRDGEEVVRIGPWHLCYFVEPPPVVSEGGVPAVRYLDIEPSLVDGEAGGTRWFIIFDPEHANSMAIKSEAVVFRR